MTLLLDAWETSRKEILNEMRMFNLKEFGLCY